MLAQGVDKVRLGFSTFELIIMHADDELGKLITSIGTAGPYLYSRTNADKLNVGHPSLLMLFFNCKRFFCSATSIMTCFY